MLKEICIWLVVIIELIASARYIYAIHSDKRMNPTLSTWIIFTLGTSLSLITYTFAEHHDLRSGVLNVMDATGVLVTFIVILFLNKKTIRFHAFEWWYLGGAGSIILYGIWTGDAFHSNLFTQCLIVFGYTPMIQKMFKEKRNTESFSSWSILLLANVIGLIPALIDGNTLSLIYATRAIICVSGTILIMWRFRTT